MKFPPKRVLCTTLSTSETLKRIVFVLIRSHLSHEYPELLNVTAFESLWWHAKKCPCVYCRTRWVQGLLDTASE